MINIGNTHGVILNSVVEIKNCQLFLSCVAPFPSLPSLRLPPDLNLSIVWLSPHSDKK